MALKSKGISFGVLSRDACGNWDTSKVEGLPAPSLSSTSPTSPPNLLVPPSHQAGAVISLHQFTNNAMNHHHGIQPVERFGAGLDPDADGLADELSIPDVTAASVYQAGLDVPGRIIPDDRDGGSKDAPNRLAWTCTSCGEANEDGFEVCRSCQAARIG